MPIYEYECGVCHFRFDRRQGFDDEPVSICPRCQGKARRVINSVPILFKGSGFYSTDHGRGYRGSVSQKKEKAPDEHKPTVKKDEETTSKGKQKK
jgi:putative FmdB family regulatory protein